MKFKTKDFEFEIKDVLEIAKKAGKAIMEIYEKDFEVEYKDDKSPLTEADKTSHKIIDYGLNKLDYKLIHNPKSNIHHLKSKIQNLQFPILSEEGKNIPYEERKNWEYFWMIDPLDGTKEFIKKNGEFTVNIALIHKDTPIFGVVHAPVLDWLYFNDNNNAYKIEKSKIYKLPIQNSKSKIQNTTFTIVASKSHLNEETKEFINNLISNIQNSTSIIQYSKSNIQNSQFKIQNPKSKIEFISIGSSLKLCLVAEGKADIYPRLAPTMEWDTAAADAIVREAGKMSYQCKNGIGYWVLDAREENNQTPNTQYHMPNTQHLIPLIYNKESLINPWFIVK